MGIRSLAFVEISVGDARRTIARLLESSANLDGVRDYVTSIDWSNAGTVDADVRELLGEIEELVHAVDEGELEADDARRMVLALINSAGRVGRSA